MFGWYRRRQLTAGEILTTTFEIGFGSLVMPMAAAGALWALLAIRLRRARAPGLLVALGTFLLCLAALLVFGVESAAAWASEPWRIAGHALLTALVVTGCSLALALLLLGAWRAGTR